MYGYKHKYIEGNLTTWPLRKRALISSPLGLMTSLALGFDHVCKGRHNSLLWGRLQIQTRTQLVTFINTLAIISPVGTSCPAGCYYSMQGLVLEKTINVFSPSAACRTPPSTVKASQQGVSSPIQDWILCVLQPNCMVSSAIGSYHLSMVGNQERWQ